MTGLIIFGSLLIGMFMGLPVCFALLAACLIYLIPSGIPLTIVPQTMIAGMNSFVLLAIPLFTMTAHSPETFNGQPGNKVQCLGRMYGAKPIRLAVVRGYLGKKLIIGYAGGSHQIQPLPHLPLYLLRDVYSQWNARFILRHIQKSLVQRNGLDDIRIFMKDFVYLAGNGFVDFHPSRDKDKLGAQLLCLQ